MEHLTNHGAEAPGLAAPERAELTPQSETPSRARMAFQGAGDGKENDAEDTSAREECKRLATAAAMLALRGYELHDLASGGMLIVKHGFRRHATELADVERFAAQQARDGGAA